MMEGNGVVVGIHEMDRTQEATVFFPFAINRRPIDVEYLSIAEQVGWFLFADPQIDVELQMTNPIVGGRDDDHVFEGELAPGQAGMKVGVPSARSVKRR